VETVISRQPAYHRAEIPVGTIGGVAAEMRLMLVSRKYGSNEVRVVSVTANTAVIENDYGDPPLSKGVRVTSKAR
jgi:hypothetical protein